MGFPGTGVSATTIGGLSGRSLPDLLPLPLEPRDSPRVGMLRAGAVTLAVDLALAAGRSGIARPPPGRFALIFEDFFWVDLATVLLVSISRLSLPKPAVASVVPGGAKEHQLYLQI